MPIDITEDRFWGFVLIALGVITLVLKPADKVHALLIGSTDRTLTALCFVLAAIVVMIGLSDKPGLKALAVFWVVTP